MHPLPLSSLLGYPTIPRFPGGLLFTLPLLSLFCLLVAACSYSPKHHQQIFTEDDTAVEVGRQVEILYSDSAVVRVRITAPTLMNYSVREDARQEFPDGVQVDFLDANQRITSTLTAKKGVRRLDTGLVTLRDSVVLRSADQQQLETEELIWDERSGRATTEKFVKVTMPGEVLYGFGLEATDDFSYWKILVPKGRVKTEQLDEEVEQ